MYLLFFIEIIFGSGSKSLAKKIFVDSFRYNIKICNFVILFKNIRVTLKLNSYFNFKKWISILFSILILAIILTKQSWLNFQVWVLLKIFVIQGTEWDFDYPTMEPVTLLDTFCDAHAPRVHNQRVCIYVVRYRLRDRIIKPGIHSISSQYQPRDDKQTRRAKERQTEERR